MTQQEIPPREWPQIKLRLPPDLHAWLKHEAINNRRTLTREAEHHIAQGRARAEQRAKP